MTDEGIETRFPKTRARQAISKEPGNRAEKPPGTVRPRENEKDLQSTEEASQATIKSPDNERLTASNHKQSFGRQSRITFGKVAWAMPYTHWYRVLLDEGNSEISCSSLMSASGQPLGTRNTSVIAPPASVLVWQHDSLPYGVILGVIPEKAIDGSATHPDSISQGSRSGFRRESYYKDFPTLFEEAGGMIDFSMIRPLDSTATGEWGHINDLGMGIFLDAFMTFLRVDEGCGIWGFYMDRLLRICGHNMDLRTAVSETMVRHDSGEGLHYAGFTPYTWEALGAFATGTTIYREYGDEDVHFNEPYGKYEPAHDDQQPFYRLEEFRDYLGQAYMRQVKVPPQYTSLAGIVNRYSREVPEPGVFREQIGLDGSWAVQSAHSISLTKRVVIPIPKRVLLPEDPTGDELYTGGDETRGYKFAGALGNGDDHKVRDAIPLTLDIEQPDIDGEEQDDIEGLPHIHTSAGLLDMLAYTYNWKGLHPFHYHKKDFVVPSHAEQGLPRSLQFRPNFTTLYDRQWLPLPESSGLNVDHRYGNVQYYETQAGITITPDGGVVIRDGYGSEIRMTGGSIQMSAPGDIWQQPGRNFNVYAGDDVIAKAQNSVDISATHHDVRLKAERHLECLAGNNGATGRILLDCQSSGSIHKPEDVEGEDIQQTGIFLKAKKAEVVTWATDIYMRSGAEAFSGPNSSKRGMIVLDAARGHDDIRQICSSAIIHSVHGLNVAIPGLPGRGLTYHFGPNVTHLPTGLCLEGGLLIRKHGIQVNGNVGGINCQMYSDRNPDGLLGVHDPEKYSWTTIKKNLDDCGEAFEDLDKTMVKDYKEALSEFWYDPERPGNADIIIATTFAPRNDKQLGTENFVLPETYWQSMIETAPSADISTSDSTNVNTDSWSENVIEYQGQDMMPHPGKKKWSEEATLWKADLQLHLTNIGRDRSAKWEGESYEEVQPGTWTRRTPDGSYPVLANTGTGIEDEDEEES